MVNKLIGLISVTIVSVFCSVAIAQGPVPLTYKGVQGQWFPRALADQVQRDLKEFDALKAKKIELDIKLDIRMSHIEDLKLAEKKASKALEACEKGLVVAENAAMEQAVQAVAAKESERSVREQADKWYRSPVFGASVGAVAIVVIEIVIWSLL
jgi:hypothetical protein